MVQTFKDSAVSRETESAHSAEHEAVSMLKIQFEAEAVDKQQAAVVAQDVVIKVTVV